MSAATEKMRAEGLPEIAIETFAHYEQLLREGDQGVIRESEIEPLTELPDAGDLPPADLEATRRTLAEVTRRANARLDAAG